MKHKYSFEISLEKLTSLQMELNEQWRFHAVNAAYKLYYEYGVLKTSSYLAILYHEDRLPHNENILLQRLLFEDIRNSSTFEKFKNYCKVHMPDLLDLVNSMG